MVQWAGSSQLYQLILQGLCYCTVLNLSFTSNVGSGELGVVAVGEEEKFINPIESSLLSDLVELYTCDLTREKHLPGHLSCLACSKQDIIRAILRYKDLDAYARQSISSVQAAQTVQISQLL